MRKVLIKDLQAGMITAKSIVTRSGRVVIPKNTTLTTQIINLISYYSIKEVSILEAESAKDIESVNNIHPSIIQYQKNIRESIEYKQFEKTFNENVEFLKEYINDLIIRSDDSLGDTILNQTLQLFEEVNHSVNIFDMLHLIRTTDTSTYAHSINVAIICRLMGEWLDYEKKDVDVLTLCGLLHDIGKTETPKEILGKPTTLTEDEYNTIKRHPIDGYNILKNQKLDPRIKRCALMHHERCDGTGYPLGLIKDDIDSFAAIVSIADVYDAMTSKRCYREAICPFEVIATFEREGVNKYNPAYIQIFLNHIVDTYMNNHVLLNDGNEGQIVWKNKNNLARPTIYLPSKEFLDLTKHPELYIQAII